MVTDDWEGLAPGLLASWRHMTTSAVWLEGEPLEALIKYLHKFPHVLGRAKSVSISLDECEYYVWEAGEWREGEA